MSAICWAFGGLHPPHCTQPQHLFERGLYTYTCDLWTARRCQLFSQHLFDTQLNHSILPLLVLIKNSLDRLQTRRCRTLLSTKKHDHTVSRFCCFCFVLFSCFLVWPVHFRTEDNFFSVIFADRRVNRVLLVRMQPPGGITPSLPATDFQYSPPRERWEF